MKLEKTVPAHTLTMYTCDCCGDVIKDRASAYITMRFNSEIWYEWWVCRTTAQSAARRWWSNGMR